MYWDEWMELPSTSNLSDNAFLRLTSSILFNKTQNLQIHRHRKLTYLYCFYSTISNTRLVGLVVWFSLRVREVPGSTPGRALIFDVTTIFVTSTNVGKRLHCMYIATVELPSDICRECRINSILKLLNLTGVRTSSVSVNSKSSINMHMHERYFKLTPEWWCIAIYIYIHIDIELFTTRVHKIL